jgi:hypothetical protein
MRKKVIYFLLLTTIYSCGVSKSIKFTQKKDEIVNTESLKKFLKNNERPKVVLRVNFQNSSVTKTENVDYLFNVIESQLLKNNFIVRDRQLFEQIIKSNDINFNYNKLKEKSDTDLIIELTKLDTDVTYETNKYFDKNNQEKVEQIEKYQRPGAIVEFKVILVKTNELAGIYKFNYTPCLEGCIVSETVWEKDKREEMEGTRKENGYEGIEKSILNEFIKNATIKLVNEMKKH